MSVQVQQTRARIFGGVDPASSSLRCPFMSLRTGLIVSRSCVQVQPWDRVKQPLQRSLHAAAAPLSSTAQLGLRLRAPAPVKSRPPATASRNGGSATALRRVRILPRQRADTRHLAFPKDVRGSGPSRLAATRNLGLNGGLASGLESYRPVVCTGCVYIFQNE